jgi:hypothetical protein
MGMYQMGMLWQILFIFKLQKVYSLFTESSPWLIDLKTSCGYNSDRVKAWNPEFSKLRDIFALIGHMGYFLKGVIRPLSRKRRTAAPGSGPFAPPARPAGARSG